MSIQPLLENVFKHTVEQRRHKTSIRVQVWRAGDVLVVRLADDAGHLAPSASRPAGIGLSNLRERLAVLYGGRASLTIEQLEPAGVGAEMRIPCAS